MNQESLFETNAGQEIIRYRPAANPTGRLDLNLQISFPHHRCGWSYALEALIPLHNPRGVLLDGFLDTTFNSVSRYSQFEPIPYRRPWIGFVHNPQNTPEWFPQEPTVQAVLGSELFQASLPNCLGLMTLSEYLASYLRECLPGIPVSAFYFPTEFNAALFDSSSFLENQQKKVVQIGWWLRKLNSIQRLPLDGNSPYRKWQLTTNIPSINQTIQGLSRIEFVRDIQARKPLEARFRDNTETRTYLPNEEYDSLLTQNLAFLDLYDASANNAVIECIARATPLLVNPIPAVVEYLGEDYPFYFETLEMAAQKALDFDLLQQTHEYLLNCPTRAKLSQEYFLNAFINSDVYQQLPEPGAIKQAS